MLCALDGRLYPLRDDAGAAARPEAAALARRYARQGAASLDDLRGSFALALWDGGKGAGLVQPDTLATTPLYLWRGAGALAFATELPALLEILPATPGPDPVGFLNWLGDGMVPVDRTLYEGISRLPPGYRLEFADGRFAAVRHWRARYTGTHGGSRQELAEGLREQLGRAVGRRVGGRASGTILSGGLDSSIVTAVADEVKPAGSELRTYSAVFPGTEYDEAWKVRRLGRRLGIEPGTFELAPRGSLWLNSNTCGVGRNRSAATGRSSTRRWSRWRPPTGSRWCWTGRPGMSCSAAPPG